MFWDIFAFLVALFSTLFAERKAASNDYVDDVLVNPYFPTDPYPDGIYTPDTINIDGDTYLDPADYPIGSFDVYDNPDLVDWIINPFTALLTLAASGKKGSWLWLLVAFLLYSSNQKEDKPKNESNNSA